MIIDLTNDDIHRLTFAAFDCPGLRPLVERIANQRLAESPRPAKRISADQWADNVLNTFGPQKGERE